MCKHCEGGVEYKPLVDKELSFSGWGADYLYIGMVSDVNYLHIEAEINNEAIVETMKINYCPMCGRKLWEGLGGLS